jgi:hypothetical protein
MTHHTKDKGDIGVAMITADLTSRGAHVLLPAFSEHLKYDLVSDFNGSLFKIQAKFRMVAGINRHVHVPASTSWSDRNGTHTTHYTSADFDLFAIWVPDIKQVLYVPVEGRGIRIAFRPRATSDYYWWEDFTEPFAEMPKRRLTAAKTDRMANASVVIAHPSLKCPRPTLRSPTSGKGGRTQPVSWPSNEVLAEMMWLEPTTAIARRLDVSDKAIGKRCAKYMITKPPRGYWSKKASQASVLSF